MNEDKVNKQLCDGCTKCCEYITVRINEPENFEEIDKLIWYLHHNIIIYVDTDNEWFLEISVKCKHLSGNGLCMIYSERPQICREHSQEDCEKQGNSTYYNNIFHNHKEFLNYVRKHPKLSKIWKKSQE